jgi:hypothetical protein
MLICLTLGADVTINPGPFIQALFLALPTDDDDDDDEATLKVKPRM